MKRLAGITMLLCLCAVASAQIQNKFWGLELSKDYTSLEIAKEIISNRCEYSYTEDNSIIALNGRFGGYDFKYAIFSFYNQNGTKRLCKTQFATYHNTYNDAKDFFKLLLQSLNNRYGPHNQTKDLKSGKGITDNVVWLWQGSAFYCNLELVEDKSYEGNTYWYINLIYCDQSLYLKSIGQEEDEL